jgi:hypothetical protein
MTLMTSSSAIEARFSENCVRSGKQERHRSSDGRNVPEPSGTQSPYKPSYHGCGMPADPAVRIDTQLFQA